MSSIASACTELCSAYDDADDVKGTKRRKVLGGWTAYGPKGKPVAEGGNSRKTISGSRVLEEIMRLVNVVYDFPPDATQRRIMKGMCGAIFEGVFEGEPESAKRRAAAQFGIDPDNVNPRFMVITPRRCGKTIAVSMFAAAYVLSRPSCTACIFSIGKRASGMLMQNVKDMVNKVAEAERATIVTSNAESLVIEKDDTQRTLYAYPGAINTLRGVGGDLIILEEAAFIPEAVVQQIVTPLLEVKGTALCCISTPMDQSNLYSKMKLMKTAEGKLVFDTMVVEMACKHCVENSADPTKCSHTDAMPPAWKQVSRRAVSQALYDGNRALMLRETLGIISGSEGAVWPANKIRGFVAAPRGKIHQRPLMLFTAMDPSGGGSSCQALLTLAVFREGQGALAEGALRHVQGSIESCLQLSAHFDPSRLRQKTSQRTTLLIVGIQNVQVGGANEDSGNHVLSYFRELHSHSCFVNTPSYLLVESNLGNEASWIELTVAGSSLSNKPRVLRETWNPETKSYRAGGCTTNSVKTEAVQLVDLLMNADCVRFCDTIVGGDSEKNIEELADQMYRFRKIPLPQRAPDAKEKYALSAKAGPDDKVSAKLNDDIAMAFMLACYWLKVMLAGELKNV